MRTTRQQTGDRNYQQGQRAETLAVWWLRLKGYRIVARRLTGYRGSGVGEIDIIARRGSTLVFVEVKRRQNYEAGLAAVAPPQQQRIVRGAERFLQTYGARSAVTCRFDVMVMLPGRWPRHIQDAFQAF